MTLFYSLTLVLSATLLFVVQPMVGKMVLPKLGGTPAVWNTCMVFFQAALLAGYAYAHGAVAALGVRRHAVLHVLLLALTLFVLNLHVGGGASPPTDTDPTVWLLSRLTLSVGMPFFVVSASAPLLQKWFADTTHPSADDPYFLYAASNLGSLTALLGYPLVLEPLLPLSAQARLWSGGYGALVAMVMGCVFLLLRSPRRDSVLTHTSSSAPRPAGTFAAEPVTAKQRLRWVALAFVPSSLMLGVTAHITTDVAAVPLLWVIPLALYLLTFVVVFSKRPAIPHRFTCWLLPYVFLPVALLTFAEMRRLTWLLAPSHLLAFFVAAMVCHGELARRRPATRHLTEFYLLISVGGVLGGMFNAFVAPVAFTRVLEYPIAMVLACLLRPPPESEKDAPAKTRRMDWVIPLVMALIGYGVVRVALLMEITSLMLMQALVFGLPAMACFSFKERPVRFGLGYAVLLAMLAYHTDLRTGGLLHSERNFFGVKRVVLDEGGGFCTLFHGSTAHGFQSSDPDKQTTPLAYYHPSGPLGDVFATQAARRPDARVAVIGLGTGAAACYAKPGQTLVFYEIDPAVVRIAENREYFTFLANCGGAYEIVLGDARLRIAEARDGEYDLLVVDAFSSDSIPTHLISLEAVALYLQKIGERAIMAFHVSNRYLDLNPVLANIAARLELVCYQRSHAVDEGERDNGIWSSRYVVMARKQEHLGQLVDKPGWQPLPADPDTPVWTDQYSDIIRPLWRGVRPDDE